MIAAVIAERPRLESQSGTPTIPIYAVYLRNVETVYEKTVELQQ